MQIQNLPIDILKPVDYNPRQISKKQFEDLKKSVQNFGAMEPAIINSFPGRENVIISGHMRIRVAQDIGMKDFPCLVVRLPMEKERELNIRMNRNTGEFNYEDLANFFEVDELLEWGFEDWEFGLKQGEGQDSFSLPDGEKDPFQQMTFTLADEQAAFIKTRIDEIKKDENFKNCETFGNENSNGNALYFAVRG